MLIRPHTLTFLLATLLFFGAQSPDRADAELTHRPASAKATVHYVIVTNFDLAPAFDQLAAHKRTHGTATVVVTTEQITALYPEGRDLAESIRLFLKDAHQFWSTRYVLLGGSPAIIPTRLVVYPSPSSLLLSPQSDLYYGGLEGNWDADGDGTLGELPWIDEAGDEIDTTVELMVGRAPVRDPEEAASFVAKTIRFVEAPDPSPEKQGLALGSVILESNTSLSEYSEAILESALESSSTPFEVERRYSDHEDWPGSLPLDATTALDLLRNGEQDWVLAMLPGDGSLGLGVAEEIIDLEALATLEGSSHEFVFLTIASQVAGLHETRVLETLMRHSSGGAVAAVGSGTTTFVATGQAFLDRFMSAALATPGATLGEAFRAAQSTDRPLGNFELRSRAGWFLLGDPQLTLRSRSVVSNPPTAPQVVLHPPHPNPFNPSTEITYELASRAEVRLVVFDARGRQVRSLVREIREPGLHGSVWDGLDDQGQSVVSGVYVVRIEADGERRSRKLALVR